MSDLFNFACDITGAKLKKPSRGRYCCETGFISMGIDWECSITYDGTGPSKGYAPRGERQESPDYPAEVEVVSVELTAVDNGKAMQPIVPPVEVSFNDLDCDAQIAIEQTCLDDYVEARRDAKEAAAEMAYELARDRADGI